MAFSFLQHLECPRCHAIYNADEQAHLCSCGSPLLVRYDLAAVKQYLNKEMLQSRPADLWRYHELLPVRAPEYVVSLGEGMTPLLPLRRLGQALQLEQLYVKDEGLFRQDPSRRVARLLVFRGPKNWVSKCW
ncbi:hypothetical protein KDW_45360 [Dictyobacter vulcani]|uniref:Threonine synthase n=1 Tax=Dictyobacter vulcani TaxID=2607529 RepID=A0A5J4KLR4_9CHLR|nr:hypothetical protein [Dictyobacter vulcani]GER90374.1 hypothetical protein KDW_45360 [Dictyobacter vulcani]